MLMLQSATPASRSTSTKKRAATGSAKTGGGDAAVAVDSVDKDEWAALAKTGAIQKKTVAQLKAFLQAHGVPATGRKAELIDAVTDFLEG